MKPVPLIFRSILVFLNIAAMVSSGFGQALGIGTDSPQAVLDITAANSGILIPRIPLTGTDDAVTIPVPVTSELIYNTASAGSGATSVMPGYYYWDGAQWVRLSTENDHDWYEVGGVVAPDNINDSIYTYGKVGIGIDIPTAPLQVEAYGLGNPSTNSIMAFNSQNVPSDRDAIITARVNGDGDGDPFFTLDILGEAGFSIGMDNSDANKLKISNQWNNLDDGAGSTKMVIQGTDGYIGIGTTAPQELLHVVNGQLLVDSVLVGLGRNDDGRVRFTKDGWGRIGSVDGLGFWPNNGVDADDNPAVFFHSNGRVGIGTTSADPKGILEVNGFVDYDLGAVCGVGSGFAYYARDAACNPASGAAGGTVDISVFASNRIVAKEFDAKSDARIKSIEDISDARNDLSLLREIEITDYRMKDSRAGRGTHKKVIGQQVRSVFPQAVSLVTEVVPDIYRLTEMKRNFLLLDADVDCGDRLKLILPEREVMTGVLAVTDDGCYVDLQYTGEVFVYGREVSDFHVVDYDALSMLHISATQELIRMLEVQEDRLNAMESELKRMQERLNMMDGAPSAEQTGHP